jgi:hypothetical protein
MGYEFEPSYPIIGVHYLLTVGCTFSTGGLTVGRKGFGVGSKCEPSQIVALPMAPQIKFLTCAVGKLAETVIMPSHSTKRIDRFGFMIFG